MCRMVLGISNFCKITPPPRRKEKLKAALISVFPRDCGSIPTCWRLSLQFQLNKLAGRRAKEEQGKEDATFAAPQYSCGVSPISLSDCLSPFLQPDLAVIKFLPATQ